ncbi:hypothetical protein Hjap01_00577 [Haloarcula japonica]
MHPNRIHVRVLTFVCMVAQFTDRHIGTRVVGQNGVKVGSENDDRVGDQPA